MRAHEAQYRPDALALLNELLANGTKSLRKWRAETDSILRIHDEPRLTTEELDSLRTLMDRTQTWLADVQASQRGKAPHENPAFTVKQLQDRYEPIQRKLTYFTRKPKPVPPKGPRPAPKLKPLPEDSEENDAPVFTALPPVEATVNDTYVYNVTTHDADEGDSVRVESVYLPPWAALVDHSNGSAQVSGMPTMVGHFAFVLRAIDRHGANETYKYFVYVRNAYRFDKDATSAKAKRPPAPAEDEDVETDEADEADEAGETSETGETGEGEGFQAHAEAEADGAQDAAGHDEL